MKKVNFHNLSKLNLMTQCVLISKGTVLGFVLILLFGCGVRINVQTNNDRIDYYQSISFMWKTDTVGKKDFRNMLYLKMQSCYNIENMDWRKVKDFFGPPNGTVLKSTCGDEYEYYSRWVNTDSCKMILIESIIFCVDEKTNKVNKFKKRYYSMG